MPEKSQLLLPNAEFRLEETNIPKSLSTSLIGKPLFVDVLPEELPCTRKVDPDDVPCWIDTDGTYWNDYRPIRISFTDSDRQVWRLPRGWLSQNNSANEIEIQSIYSVTKETHFEEALHLPSVWDLWEINIPWSESVRACGRMQIVQVKFSPGQPMKVLWRDSKDAVWRIPHDWRRRRIKLPSYEVLVAQGIPNDVAESYSDKAVSVNYHPGSLCCLPTQYRFRDEAGNRWLVFKKDCILLGYGDKPEFQA